jgi:SLT domain-containing protein
MPENLSTIRQKDLINQKNHLRNSFDNNSFSNFEETIRNDTKKFNELMENQYKEFDYSYYYVEPSTKALVRIWLKSIKKDKKIATTIRLQE